MPTKRPCHFSKDAEMEPGKKSKRTHLRQAAAMRFHGWRYGQKAVPAAAPIQRQKPKSAPSENLLDHIRFAAHGTRNSALVPPVDGVHYRSVYVVLEDPQTHAKLSPLMQINIKQPLRTAVVAASKLRRLARAQHGDVKMCFRVVLAHKGVESPDPDDVMVGGGGFASDYEHTCHSGRDMSLAKELEKFNEQYKCTTDTDGMTLQEKHGIMDLFLRVSAAWTWMKSTGKVFPDQPVQEYFQGSALLRKCLQVAGDWAVVYQPHCANFKSFRKALEHEIQWAVVCELARLPFHPLLLQT